MRFKLRSFNLYQIMKIIITIEIIEIRLFQNIINNLFNLIFCFPGDFILLIFLVRRFLSYVFCFLDLQVLEQLSTLQKWIFVLHFFFLYLSLAFVQAFLINPLSLIKNLDKWPLIKNLTEWPRTLTNSISTRQLILNYHIYYNQVHLVALNMFGTVK